MTGELSNHEREAMEENGWLHAQHIAATSRLDARQQLLRQRRGELAGARNFDFQSGVPTKTPHPDYVSNVLRAVEAVTRDEQIVREHLEVVAMAVSESLDILIKQATLEMNAQLRHPYISPTAD